MKPAELQFTLRQIPQLLRDALDDSAKRVVEQAAASLNGPIERLKGKSTKKLKGLGGWGLRIDRNEPLRFSVCSVRKYRVQVDLFCDTRWPADPDAVIESHTMGVRVWALDSEVYFRPNWDAAGMQARLASHGRRVIMRWHYDRANADQDGPVYHLQVGGNPEGTEFCWLHPFLQVPRFVCAPTDLVLACEFIIANFYSPVFDRIRKEPGWKALVRKSQEELLHDYYSKCHAAMNRGDSILDALWNK